MILFNFISVQALTVYMETLRFEIPLRSNWPKWYLHQCEFHFARSHVNADNEVTSYWSEFYPQGKSQTSLSSHRVSCGHALKLCFNEMELKFLKAPLICSLAVLNKTNFKYHFSHIFLFVLYVFIFILCSPNFSTV